MRADVELFRRDDVRLDRRHGRQHAGVRHEGDQQARGIVGRCERVLTDDQRQFLGRHHDDGNLDAKVRRDGGRDVGSEFLRHALARFEDHVAAVEQRANVGVAEILQ